MSQSSTFPNTVHQRSRQSRSIGCWIIDRLSASSRRKGSANFSSHAPSKKNNETHEQRLGGLGLLLRGKAAVDRGLEEGVGAERVSSIVPGGGCVLARGQLAHQRAENLTQVVVQMGGDLREILALVLLGYE